MEDNVVTVFGSSQAEPHSELYQIAHELGTAIAELGLTLCNGGYGGTMEAAARGAFVAGGHTIGVTCTRFSGRGGANPYIRQEIPTADLFRRLETLIRLGRAFVVLPGGTGTLVELALVWEHAAKGSMPDRPIVCVGRRWLGLRDVVAEADPRAAGCVRFVEGPECLDEFFAPAS